MPLAMDPQARPTLRELAQRYGNLPARRIRLDRYPADENDVEELRTAEGRIYELIEGVLLEKEMGYQESMIGMKLGRLLGNFIDGKHLGIVAGADGMMKLAPGLVRIPDVSFVRKEQFPGSRVSSIAAPNMHPDLAVEVLSPSNTDEEMDEKLRDYFASGTSLVWLVEPDTRSVLVLTGPDRSTATRLTVADNLDGGSVLPSFSLSVAVLFAELDAI